MAILSLSFILCIATASIIIRYSTYTYNVSSVIQVIDKAQDSEMALPTAMTIFNRSMINLENEIGVLTSYTLHKEVCSELNSNVRYFTKGVFVDFENHPRNWFNDYDIEFKIDTDSIVDYYRYEFNVSESSINIKEFDKNDEILNDIEFVGNTTKIKPHSFPFEITIRDKIEEEISKRLIIESFEKTVKRFRKNVIIQQSGKESDQLTTSLVHQNTIISSEYLNSLNSAFDYDGIEDRQLEYKRTIDFVITRSQILKNDPIVDQERKILKRIITLLISLLMQV